MPDRAQNRLVVSPHNSGRLAAAARWVNSYGPDQELILLAANSDAADDFTRLIVGGRARFGLIKLTLDRLATRLAAATLAGRGLAPASDLSLSAILTRCVHSLLAQEKISYFAPICTRPGFPRAAAATIEELRMNCVRADDLRALERGGPDLAVLYELFAGELERQGLADRAARFEAALEAAASAPRAPLLLLDVRITSLLESRLISQLARQADSVFATSPRGDSRSMAYLCDALTCDPSDLLDESMSTSLASLRKHLFEESAPPLCDLDGSVDLKSWPGEAREAVEIARAVQTEAAGGVSFDRMAIFLRSSNEYRPHIEEAFQRAAIPVYFARGSTRPDSGGRAMLALLACAAERLSARRFAEYLSLSQVPSSSQATSPDPADGDAAWAPPESDLIPERMTASEPQSDKTNREPPVDPDAAVSVEGLVLAPWRWEELLVEASVIGGKDRWARRLAGLEREMTVRRQELTEEDEARAALLDRRLRDLIHLREFALPIIEKISGWPKSALWVDWIRHLTDLAAAAIREPEGVIKTIEELEPMAEVGPVDLDEVRVVLAPRLRELATPPPRRRYGAVFVGPADSARGLAFDIVFVPGLAEKLFPRKVIEDPILLDSERRRLESSNLITQRDRNEAERLALRLAIGAAANKVYLSFPRIDVQQGRPRVPSFYGLEILRSAQGDLPGFEKLGTMAETGAGARLGWPAPSNRNDAIDEAEYDLAVLAPIVDADPDAIAGAAHYLLTANPHLERALRARARRWLKRWTPADGLVEPDALAKAALELHQFSARSFSPTALQNYASCPYRFFLQAIHRLEPREEPAAIEVIDPLTRGSLFHHVQFRVLSALRASGTLPVTPSSLADAIKAVDHALDEAAARYEDELAPAIPKVWEDGINTIRADLREWLRRAPDSRDGWVPYKFELSFGLSDRGREDEDPDSSDHAVLLPGGLQLRGSIDLVERRVDNAGAAIRATDHKTGKIRASKTAIVEGGHVLQPVLYALACETLLKERVEAGRLYYCTADGGYEDRVVEMRDLSRDIAGQVIDIVGTALNEGFLPALPEKGACNWCDYRMVCGPFEEIRTARKPADRLEKIHDLRMLP